jgi:hypothetical protein
MNKRKKKKLYMKIKSLTINIDAQKEIELLSEEGYINLEEEIFPRTRTITTHEQPTTNN